MSPRSFCFEVIRKKCAFVPEQIQPHCRSDNGSNQEESCKYEEPHPSLKAVEILNGPAKLTSPYIHTYWKIEEFYSCEFYSCPKKRIQIDFILFSVTLIESIYTDVTVRLFAKINGEHSFIPPKYRMCEVSFSSLADSDPIIHKDDTAEYQEQSRNR